MGSLNVVVACCAAKNPSVADHDNLITRVMSLPRSEACMDTQSTSALSLGNHHSYTGDHWTGYPRAKMSTTLGIVQHVRRRDVVSPRRMIHKIAVSQKCSTLYISQASLEHRTVSTIIRWWLVNFHWILEDTFLPKMVDQVHSHLQLD